MRSLRRDQVPLSAAPRMAHRLSPPDAARQGGALQGNETGLARSADHQHGPCVQGAVDPGHRPIGKRGRQDRRGAGSWANESRGSTRTHRCRPSTRAPRASASRRRGRVGRKIPSKPCLAPGLPARWPSTSPATASTTSRTSSKTFSPCCATTASRRNCLPIRRAAGCRSSNSATSTRWPPKWTPTCRSFSTPSPTATTSCRSCRRAP